MLSSTLFGAFTTPVTYFLLVILLGTAVMQVRYVNRALQRFESTQVIPIQFVLFTLCVITGSAVLYRDFERTTTEEALKFIGGCLLTFFGVFLITSGRHREEDEDTLSDVEGIEETIGLAEHGYGPRQRTQSVSTSSRRSSRATRVSFMDAIVKPLSVQHDTGVPPLRVPASNHGSRPPLESTPLLSTSLDAADTSTYPPGLRSISADSVAVVSRTSMDSAEGATPSTPMNTNPFSPNFGVERPNTPRAPPSSSRPHSHHYPDLLISPSPLSSTVSAVVKDTLRRSVRENPLLHKSSLRKIRSSIRASLFMPEDDDDLSGSDDDQVGPSRLRAVVTAESPPPPDGYDSSGSKTGVRRRARSLSNTLGEFFGVKRKKRGSVGAAATPEGEGGFSDGEGRP